MHERVRLLTDGAYTDTGERDKSGGNGEVPPLEPPSPG